MVATTWLIVLTIFAFLRKFSNLAQSKSRFINKSGAEYSHLTSACFLNCQVCCYALHYFAFAFSTKAQQWLLLDDTNVKVSTKCHNCDSASCMS
jgi:hypothetical protein